MTPWEVIQLSSVDPLAGAWFLYAILGWIVLVWFLLKGLLYSWGYYKAVRYSSNWNWTLLAIDVPQENIQTPKAVEQLFAHIFSVMEPPSIQSVYRRGFVQFSYSFEIVSIEGYIQFLVRTLDIFRDVVEAAVYAQYPEAEITEVDDYVNAVPTKYPNDTHNVSAMDFALTQHYAYPIRCYQDFEHSISKDTILKDPMGTFLESFSRIGPGEQMWYQMIIEPLEEKRWKEEVMKKVKDLIGEKKVVKPSVLDKVLDVPGKAIEFAGNQIFNLEEGAAPAPKVDDAPKNDILFLTPGQKEILEAMERKIGKIGFKTKLRAAYIGRHEVYMPERGMNSLVGAINNFNIPSSNSILPKYLTSTRYLFAKKRKNYRRTVLMSAYKSRNMYAGKDPYVLNLEELATIWHFPMSYVKTPLLQKSGTKRSEPPADLPIEGVLGAEGIPDMSKELPAIEEKQVADIHHGGFSEDQKFG